MMQLSVLIVGAGMTHGGDLRADPVSWGWSIVVGLIGLGAIVWALYPWLRRRR